MRARRNVEVEIIHPAQYPVPPLISEENYGQQMQEIVLPRLGAVRESGRFGEKGELYYELFPQHPNKGTIVLCHGFTEFIPKMYELIYYFLEDGFQCAIFDQRGHGKSQREGKEDGIVHIDTFDTYVKDLHRFLLEIAARKMNLDRERLFLFGHSMGGCISARYVETYPDDFARVILNSPMLGINLGKIPEWAAVIICSFMQMIGKGTEPIIGQGPFDPKEKFENASCRSRARFAYSQLQRIHEKAYQQGPADYSWGKAGILAGRKAVSASEIRRIKANVLMIIAGQDTLVQRSSQDRFLSRLRSGKAVLMPECKHETYRDINPVLRDYLSLVLAYLNK